MALFRAAAADSWNLLMRSFWIVAVCCVLLIVAGFSAGAAVMRTGLWPAEHINNLYEFVRGDPDEHTNVLQKLLNDMDIVPYRVIHPYKVNASESFRPLPGLPLSKRRALPILSVAPKIRPGYIYIVGKFDFPDALNGVLLLTTDGKLVRYWKMPGSLSSADSYHLFAFRHDGSFISAATNERLYHIDACGKWLGTIAGQFHHSIAAIDGERYYIGGSIDSKDAFSVVNVDTMTIERTIRLEAIHDAADPDLDIFNLWIHGGYNVNDLWHLNDVDPFPPTAHSDRFKMGDLLISYRHSDLVYVIDPDTLKLKWWTHTYTSGQHDPDWRPDGTITVYNNRLSATDRYSTIVHFDMENPKPTVIFDGRKYDFYSEVRGKHTSLDDGSLLLLSSNQGRVLWIDKDGNILFDFVNRYSDTQSLEVLNTGYLPPGYFGKEGLTACEH